MHLDEKQLRPLVRQLSKTAAVLDAALFGPPVHPARNVDYQQRQREQQKRAARELESLRQVLAGIRL
jgi:hypothetical protein